MSLYGKNLICTQDWTIDELIMKLLNTAVEMKLDRTNVASNRLTIQKSIMAHTMGINRDTIL
jgi:ornithine carbamoyltransferase